MKTTVVTMGGKDYEIAALPVRRSREWREQFGQPITQIMGSLQAAGEALGQAASKDAAIDVGNLVGTLSQAVLSGLGQTLLNSMDMALEMVLSYAPTLAADRETIEENAYDDEVILALVEVLKLAYPFGELLTLVNPGRKGQPTRKS